LALNTGESHHEYGCDRTETAIYCHVCHCECDSFLRRDFLRPH
jgi:hypothetical protein